MKVGDLVKWGDPHRLAHADIGLVVDIGTGDGAGLADVEWARMPVHSGYIPIEEPELKVINEG